MDYQQLPTQQTNQQVREVRDVQQTQHVQQAQQFQQQQYQQTQQPQPQQQQQQYQQGQQQYPQPQQFQPNQVTQVAQLNQLNSPNQTNPSNQSMGLNEALGFLMNKFQSLDGSSRRQTGDIAQIKGKLDRLDRLDSLAGVEELLNSFQGNNFNNVVTREEFNKAINYLHREVVTRLNTVQQNQQLLINELRQLRQVTSNVSNTPNASNVSNEGQGKNQLISAATKLGTGTAVKVSLPMIGDVNVNLPIPLKFVKPVIIGILIFIGIVIILVSM